MTAVLERYRAVRPVRRLSLLSPQAVLDKFLENWTGTRLDGQVPRLVSELNRSGWRCAIVDGGNTTALWKLLVRSGHNQRLPVTSVAEGLRGLDAVQESRQFELVILYDIPCSLSRVIDWLGRTPGSGAILWLRQGDAVLLEEVQVAEPVWRSRLGQWCDRLLYFFDRWGI